MTSLLRVTPALTLLCLFGATTSLAPAEISRSVSGPHSIARFEVLGTLQDGQLSPGDAASNDALWEKAQKMYAANDFAQASAAAAHVTSPSLRKNAQAMISEIQAYVAALQDGAAAEGRHDPAAAIAAYAAAARIKSDGPGDPTVRITRVQQQAAAGQLSKQQQAQAQQAQNAARVAQLHARSAQLLKKGLAQEAAGDTHGALASLGAAQSADPANGAVSAALTRLKAPLPTPASTDAELSPAPAIRDFYNGEYDKAVAELTTVVASGNAKSLGAGYFYLGAAHVYRSVLESGQSPTQAAGQPEVQAAFRQARSLGYVPLPAFVSPELLRLWQAGQ